MSSFGQGRVAIGAFFGTGPADPEPWPPRQVWALPSPAPVATRRRFRHSPRALAGGSNGVRKFLVVLDETRECLNAMRFAAMRASRTGGAVQVLSVISPADFGAWVGVGDIMREEARERIEVHFEVFAKWMRDRQGIDPELVIREGEAVTAITEQIQDDPEIGVLVLGAGTDSKGPGPLVTALTKVAGTLSIPITIVPGDLSKERLEAIT